MHMFNKTKRSFFPGSQGWPRQGFALIAALLALWVLTAVGILIFSITTQDIRITSRIVGEKKAFSAAEAGTNWLTQNFNPANLGASVVDHRQVDPNNDTASRFTVTQPTPPTTGPAAIPDKGSNMSGSPIWGQVRYLATVTGTNTKYNNKVEIDAGIGYGPVDVSTYYH